MINLKRNGSCVDFGGNNDYFADVTSSTSDLLNSFQAFCHDQDKQLQKFSMQFWLQQKVAS